MLTVLCMFILINLTNLKHFWTTHLGVIWPIFEQQFIHNFTIHIFIIYMEQQLFVKMMNLFIRCQIYYCSTYFIHNGNWALNSFNCFNLLSKIFMQNRIIKLTDYLQFIIQTHTPTHTFDIIRVQKHKYVNYKSNFHSLSQ